MSILKAMLIVVIFNAQDQHAIYTKQFDNMDLCKEAADSMMKAMEENEKIRRGFAICTTELEPVKRFI